MSVLLPNGAMIVLEPQQAAPAIDDRRDGTSAAAHDATDTKAGEEHQQDAGADSGEAAAADFAAEEDTGKLQDAWWYKEYMDKTVPNTQTLRWSTAFAPGPLLRACVCACVRVRVCAGDGLFQYSCCYTDLESYRFILIQPRIFDRASEQKRPTSRSLLLWQKRPTL